MMDRRTQCCRALPLHTACPAPARYAVAAGTSVASGIHLEVIRTLSCGEHRGLAAHLVRQWGRRNLPRTPLLLRVARWLPYEDPGVWILGASVPDRVELGVEWTVAAVPTAVRAAA